MRSKIILLSAAGICSLNSVQAQKFSFQGNIGLKQHFLYNKNRFLNTNPKAYDFVTKPNPCFELDAIYNLKKMAVSAGIAVFPTKYWAYYNFHAPHTSINQQFGLGITSLQLPIRFQYQLTPKFKAGLGIAVNYHSFSSQSYSTQYDIDGSDSIDIEWNVKSPDFYDYFSVSGQAILSFQPYKHFGLNFLLDMDWHQYPSIDFEHEFSRPRQPIQKSRFYGSPKMLYTALSLSYTI